ncbi:MAG: MFS transporter [Chloroflexi bacterium]|nr:MFS transporter [Chloroflexota bacterium]
MKIANNQSKIRIAILSCSLLNILMNAGIVPVMSILADEIPNAIPSTLKFTLSISSIFCVLFSLMSGYIERQIPRKILLSIGLFLYAIGGIGGGLVNSVEGLLFTRAILGIGGGFVIPLSTAYIADLFEGDERQKMVGESLFAANLGAMALPLVGTWLAQVNWRLGFLIYSAALVALILVWLFIPDLPREHMKSEARRKLFYFSGPVLWASFLYFFVMVLFVSLPSNFSLFVAEEKLGSASTAAWITSFSTLSAMLVSPFFSRFYCEFNKWMLPIGFAICGLGFAVMGFLPGVVPSLAGNILIGASLGLMHPFFPYMAMKDTPREHSTSAQALVTSGFRLGTFVSPFFFLFANWTIGFNSIRGEFILSALIFFLAVAVSVIAFYRTPIT